MKRRAAGFFREEAPMKLPRRQFLHLAAGAAALPAVSRFAYAQAYPTRPVRIIVGFAAGGQNDINARLIGQWLSERLGQQFIIDNRPGASGNIAMESVVRSPPDGYTLVMVATSSAVNATLFENLPFNFQAQYGVARKRDRAPYGERVVQADDRRAHVTCALSRLGADAERPSQWSSAIRL
jgi:Tripartite tricarboxylate transporter family receptor